MESLSEPGAEVADVVVARTGEITVGLETSDGRLWSVSLENPTAEWGMPAPVDAGTDGSGSFLALGAGASVAAAWRHVDPMGVVQIWANGRSTDAVWPNPVLLDDGQSGEPGLPRVGVDGAGDVFVTWSRDDPGQPGGIGVLARRHESGADAWEPAEWANDELSGTGSKRLAVSAAGDAALVWDPYDAPNDAYPLVAAIYDASASSWLEARAIQSPDGGATASQPSVGADAGGGFVAVWRAGGSVGPNEIRAGRYDGSAGTWSDPETISSSATDRAESPSVAVDEDGNAIAAWEELVFPDPRRQVWASTYSRTEDAWDAPERLDDGEGDASSPRVALAVGRGLVAWQKDDDGTTEVWAYVRDF